MYLFNRAGYNAYMMRDKKEQMDTEMNTDPGYYYTMKDDICLDTKDEAYPFTRYRYCAACYRHAHARFHSAICTRIEDYAGCPCPRSTSKKAGMRMRVSRLEGAIQELTEYVEDYLNVATAAAGSTVGLANLIARARAMSLITMARSVLAK